MKLAHLVNNLLEADDVKKDKDAFNKALASIEVQFGKNTINKVSQDNPKGKDLPSLGSLKYMVLDFENRGKKPLAKMMQRKIDRGEFSKAKPKKIFNIMDAGKLPLFKNMISLLGKTKDKDVINHIKQFLKEAENFGVLDKTRGKQGEELRSIWPKL